MLMEGTGKYFLWLFLIFLIVYIAVKISLAFLLTRAKEKAWKGYVPIYTTYVFVRLLGLNKKIFYFSLIPFVNLYYYYIIIKELLKGYGQDSRQAIWFIIFPMYKFPELAFKRPKFLLNEYDLTEEFLETQDMLFNKPEEATVQEVQNVTPAMTPVNSNEAVNNSSMIINPVSYEQMPVNNNLENPNIQGNNLQNIQQNVQTDSVFTNKALEPDKTHTTYVEAKQEVKEEKPIITPVATGKPKLCPNCGARLAPDAKVCFLCGTKL